jgi:protein-disulfide isomerase
VFRSFPLTEMHPHAAHAAEAAEFAGRHGKFWEMHDTIFEHQSHLEDASLASYAKHVGLKDSDLLQSLAAGDDRARVSHDFSTGVRSGVNGTPTFFINGARHDAAPSFEDLSAAIDHALR